METEGVEPNQKKACLMDSNGVGASVWLTSQFEEISISSIDCEHEGKLVAWGH